MQPVLLDTDMLSYLMRGHPTVVDRAEVYLAEFGRFSFSIITRYEILRGLKAKRAEQQQVAFDRLCAASLVLALTDQVVVKAAAIYGDLYRRGALISDADMLIAATALTQDLVLCTNNVRHFERVEGLDIENWLKG